MDDHEHGRAPDIPSWSVTPPLRHERSHTQRFSSTESAKGARTHLSLLDRSGDVVATDEQRAAEYKGLAPKHQSTVIFRFTVSVIVVEPEVLWVTRLAV